MEKTLHMFEKGIRLLFLDERTKGENELMPLG